MHRTKLPYKTDQQTLANQYSGAHSGGGGGVRAPSSYYYFRGDTLFSSDNDQPGAG